MKSKHPLFYPYRFLLLCIAFTALALGQTAFARTARWTCNGQCLLMNGNVFAGMYNLPPGKSNYNEGTAREILDNKCAKISSQYGANHYQVVRGVIELRQAHSDHSASTVQSGAAYGPLGGLRGSNITVHTEKSQSDEKQINFNPEEPECIENKNIKSSPTPEYSGNRDVKG